MTTPDIEKIAVMQAYLEGKEIEYRIIDKKDSDWEPNKFPSWTWGVCEYRVKPQPEYKLDREKHNKLFKLFTEKYDFDVIEFNQLIMDLGEIFGVTIKTE